MRYQILALGLLAQTACFSGPVFAQEQKLFLADPKAFREAYLSSAPSGTRSTKSAEMLVGVRIGSPAGTFNVKGVRLSLGKQGGNTTICMRTIARDGRYSAAATYTGQASSASPTLDIPTRYEDDLKSYKASDMAIIAYTAPSCDIARSTDLYAVLTGDSKKTDDLVIQVNAPTSRVRAQIFKGESPLGNSVICSPNESGPRVGFTSECRIPIVEQNSGAYRLVLSETTANGSGQNRVFQLHIIRDGL